MLNKRKGYYNKKVTVVKRRKAAAIFANAFQHYLHLKGNRKSRIFCQS